MFIFVFAFSAASAVKGGVGKGLGGRGSWTSSMNGGRPETCKFLTDVSWNGVLRSKRSRPSSPEKVMLQPSALMLCSSHNPDLAVLC